jgi:site-specific DNA-methyltransferase (adenine-specific)
MNIAQKIIETHKLKFGSLPPLQQCTVSGSALFNADCMDILPLIPDESVDLILTDPPYNIGYADWDKFFNIPEITKQWYRILKHNGSVFCFAEWCFVCSVINKFDKRFKLNDWIIYDRIKGRRGRKGLVSTREDLLWYVKSNEWIFNKDKAYTTIKKKTKGMGEKNGRDTRALSNVWTDTSPIVSWSKELNIHPTQKPLQIAERILDLFSNTESVILDCYTGSGTFLEAAKNKKNTFIGIEKEPKYYDLAVARVFR